MNASRNDFFRQTRKVKEKTKKLQAVPKNARTPKLAWRHPHSKAEAETTRIFRGVSADRIRRSKARTKVSTMGANTTEPKKSLHVAEIAGRISLEISTPMARDVNTILLKIARLGSKASGNAIRQ